MRVVYFLAFFLVMRLILLVAEGTDRRPVGSLAQDFTPR
jgi:hypothetical protein